MMSRRWGRIINFSGIAANMGIGGKTAISTVKAGIVGFTKSLARELGSYGITVNSISPGDIEVVRDPGYDGKSPCPVWS
jgi:3-oxoacyl-[acyl-carrier protein] reductase